MKLNIIDASVAVKWFVENEPERDLAFKILDLIKDNPTFYAVPEFFFNEMLSVLCRLSPNEKVAIDYIHALQDLGLNRLGNGRELMDEACRIAMAYHLTGYDAIYVANAKLAGGYWITADDKAYQKVKQLRVSKLLSETIHD